MRHQTPEQKNRDERKAYVLIGKLLDIPNDTRYLARDNVTLKTAVYLALAFAYEIAGDNIMDEALRLKEHARQ